MHPFPFKNIFAVLMNIFCIFVFGLQLRIWRSNSHFAFIGKIFRKIALSFVQRKRKYSFNVHNILNEIFSFFKMRV